MTILAVCLTILSAAGNPNVRAPRHAPTCDAKTAAFMKSFRIPMPLNDSTRRYLQLRDMLRRHPATAACAVAQLPLLDCDSEEFADIVLALAKVGTKACQTALVQGLQAARGTPCAFHAIASHIRYLDAPSQAVKQALLPPSLAPRPAVAAGDDVDPATSPAAREEAGTPK